MTAGRVGRVFAAAAAALALAGAANAKEPVSGKACGANGCRALDHPGVVYQAIRWDGTFDLVAAPAPARFHTLTFSAPGPRGFRWSLVYVPSRRVVRVDDRGATWPEVGPAGRPYWRTLGPRQIAVLAAATRGTVPFPASPLWRSTR